MAGPNFPTFTLLLFRMMEKAIIRQIILEQEAARQLLAPGIERE